VAEKQRLIATVPASWPDAEPRWAAVRDRLAAALELAPAVERALDAAQIPDRSGYLEIDEPTLRATFRYATRLRARYTTVDFLEGQRRLEAAIEAATSGRAAGS
jgi:hypothetical protein